MNPVSISPSALDPSGQPEVSWTFNFTAGSRCDSASWGGAASEAPDAFGHVSGLVTSLDQMLHRSVATDVPTVLEAAQCHLERLWTIGETTKMCYVGFIRNSLGDLAQKPITDVTRDDIALWVRMLKEDVKNSCKTIQNKHAFLASVFEEYIELLPHGNPCRKQRLPEGEEKPMTFLTPAEMMHFLGFVETHWQPLVKALFLTGLRFGEITAVRIGQVDVTNRRLVVSRAWKRNTIGAPKTKSSVRTITLSPEAMAIFLPLMEGRGADDLLFTNTDGGRVKHSCFFSGAWRPAVFLANGEQIPPSGGRIRVPRYDDGTPIPPATKPLGKRPRIHDARHSHASWLLAMGVPMHVVQQQLGHSTITTTIGTYAHLLPTAHDAVSDALSAILVPDPE